MKNLVLKDIKLLGFVNLFLLAVPLALGVIGTRVGEAYMSTMVYTLAALIPVYLLVIRMAVSDMQSNADPMIISLPVKRFDIVKSRYISVLIYTFLIAGFVFLSSNISTSLEGVLFSSGNGSVFTPSAMFLTISLIILFVSVNIPLQYFDPRKTQIFNALFYASIVLSPNIIKKLDIDIANTTIVQDLLNIDLKVLSPIFLGVSLIMYLASLLISKNIYARKEF